MNNGLKVIGIDPGAMTGVFIWTYVDHMPGRPLSDPQASLDARQVSAASMPKVLRHLFHAECAGMRTVVAVERYIITARTAKLSQQADALEVTGMVKALAALDNIEVRQYLKANLKFASDAALRDAGWYSPKMRHANDAARQAFALLKDVDYPAWSRVASSCYDGIQDDERTTDDADH